MKKIYLELVMKREDCLPLSVNDFQVIFLSFLNNPYFKINNEKYQKDFDTNRLTNIVNVENNYTEENEISALDMYMYYLYSEKYILFLEVIKKLIDDNFVVSIKKKYLDNEKVDIKTFLLSHLIKSCNNLIMSSKIKEEINLMYSHDNNGNEKLDTFNIQALMPTIKGYKTRTKILNGEVNVSIPLELYKVVDAVFCNRSFDFKILINNFFSSERSSSITKLIQIQSDSRYNLLKQLSRNNYFILKNRPFYFCSNILVSVIFKIIYYFSLSNSNISRMVNRRILFIGKFIYLLLHRVQNYPFKLNLYYRRCYLKSTNIKYE